jgi:SnoaL-like domain
MNNEDRLKTWNLYQSAWGPIGVEERRSLLERSVAQHCVYTDPASQTHGLDELAARIDQSQARFPGARFRNDSFLEHHDQALFHWTMYDGNDDVFVHGSSFGRFDDQGLLVQMTGFFKAPSSSS